MFFTWKEHRVFVWRLLWTDLFEDTWQKTEASWACHELRKLRGISDNCWRCINGCMIAGSWWDNAVNFLRSLFRAICFVTWIQVDKMIHDSWRFVFEYYFIDPDVFYWYLFSSIQNITSWIRKGGKFGVYAFASPCVVIIIASICYINCIFERFHLKLILKAKRQMQIMR